MKKLYQITSIFFPSLGILGLFLLLSTANFAQISQTINFPDIPVKGYGETSFTLNATASSGLAVTYLSSNTAVATISGNKVTIKTTTGYAYISAFQNGNSTYTAATSVPQLLIVVPKATLTITADNKAMTVGESMPALTYTITDFKNGETSSALTGMPLFQALGSSLAEGLYPIVINRGTMSASNYELMMVDGQLTVNSRNSSEVLNEKASVLHIYPNPASDSFVVLNAANENLMIVDLTGKIVLKSRCLENTFRQDISTLTSGMYTVKIINNNNIIPTKLLVQR